MKSSIATRLFRYVFIALFAVVISAMACKPIKANASALADESTEEITETVEEADDVSVTDSGSEDESNNMMIILVLGGGLVIIIAVVIAVVTSTVSTVASAVEDEEEE